METTAQHFKTNSRSGLFEERAWGQNDMRGKLPPKMDQWFLSGKFKRDTEGCVF